MSVTNIPPHPAHPIRPPVPDEPVVLPPIGYLRLLYPGFFDPNSPKYIDPQTVIIGMLSIAEEMRPPCLPEKMQNIAQAFYTAYLLEEWLKQQPPGSGGGSGAINSGIILSEKEGDIAVTYAEPLSYKLASGGGSGEGVPPASAWEKWKRLYDLCKKGAITTRFGYRGSQSIWDLTTSRWDVKK